MTEQDVKAAEDARRAKQAENNAKAAEVMEKSVPVPTQEENDLAKLGVPVEVADPGNPEMPPLHEQTVEPDHAARQQQRQAARPQQSPPHSRPGAAAPVPPRNPTT